MPLHQTTNTPCKLMLTLALLSATSCSNGDTISKACDALSECNTESSAACIEFYEQVLLDLDDRCGAPTPVKNAYLEGLDCVAREGCTIFTTNACTAEFETYEQAKLADGPACEPDDD